MDQNVILKKKRPQICSKIAKNPIFLKFQLWVWGRKWHKIDGDPRSILNSYQNFFYDQNLKIDDFIQKKHTTTPKKGSFFWRGGEGRKFHASIILRWLELGPTYIHKFKKKLFFLKILKTDIFFLIEIKMRNSKGRSADQGTLFHLFYKNIFAAFSHRKLKVAQIWSTHQSKALIFYSGIKNKIWVWVLKILSKTDKLNFIFWNLGCV